MKNDKIMEYRIMVLVLLLYENPLFEGGILIPDETQASLTVCGVVVFLCVEDVEVTVGVEVEEEVEVKFYSVGAAYVVEFPVRIVPGILILKPDHAASICGGVFGAED